MFSLGHIIKTRLESEPNRRVARFLSDSKVQDLTASRLNSMARRIAGEIRNRAPERSPVGVALYSGAALHTAWLGCVWAGRIPTMVAPPSPRMEPQKYISGLEGILKHLGLGALLVDAAARDLLAPHVPSTLQLIVADGESGEEIAQIADPSADEIVLVQHSSGTTGIQKALALTSRQILNHHEAYAKRIGLTRDDVIVSWLPLYHDMGFVACLLQPMIEGIEIIEMSPFAWANRPAMLLEAIHAHRPTLCWMPNFAFALLSEPRVIRSLSGLDLSSVRAWINCSEPVMATSFDHFASALSPFGVTQDSLLASYAMAENVFAVTQSEIGAPRRIPISRDTMVREQIATLAACGEDCVTLVSNGRALPTTELEVRDANGASLSEGRIGEFCLRGSHRFDGYFMRPDLTRAAIDEAGWYATGDLGFIMDGHAYVTGRKKDLIIIRGRNYYSQDVEDVVATVAGVRRGRIVAFSLPDDVSGTEKLIILAEAETDFEDRHWAVALDIRKQIAQTLDTTVFDVRIVPDRWLVKSTAGKLARADNRAKYLVMVARQVAHV